MHQTKELPLDKITEHLFCIHDTCSTYVVDRDGKGLTIDCGQLGPGEVGRQTGLDVGDRLLLTHFHRDQCGAASEWVRDGGIVSVPFSEKRFFEESDILRASYDIYDNYTAYYPAFGPLDDVRGEPITDYDSVSWLDLNFQAIPLPGHTFGSTGYLFEIDGERMLAVGDVMAAPGKLHEYYSSQWTYMSFQGHVNLLESLAAIQRLNVDRILPGHGDPFEATESAFTELTSRLIELHEMYYEKPYQPFRPTFTQLSDHVYEVDSAAHTYIVKDDDGHGLLIDCGYVSNARIGADPHRFIDHLTPWLEEGTGVTDVEWFLPSHYHDDHLAGLPTLQIKYGTKVASSPEVKDILEHPERYEMPCLVPHGTKVDRVIERDEVFHWRGIDFRMEQFPGQTWYHHLITFNVDGKRYLSIGDNISGMCFREKRDFIHSFIPKNRTPVSSYSDMPRQIKARNPDVILTGHGGGVDVDPEKIASWQVWMDRWTELFTDIIDQPHPNLGMDPHWVEFYPYKVRVKPGDQVKFEVRVRNHETEARTGSIAFRAPEGVNLSPESVEMKIGPEQDAVYVLNATVPEDTRVHSWTVVADVTWNGKHLGEISEGIMYW